MRKAPSILPFILFVVVLDRFFFLPGRMDHLWQYEKGVFYGDTLSYDNIQIDNNFEIKINKDRQLNSCYLLGCYFGNLYLLDTQTLEYTKYTVVPEGSFWD